MSKIIQTEYRNYNYFLLHLIKYKIYCFDTQNDIRGQGVVTVMDNDQYKLRLLRATVQHPNE